MQVRDIISSIHNPKVKRLLLLQQKSAERQKHDLFVVEGERELKRCIQNGYEVESVFFCRDIICKGLETFMADSDGVALYEVSKQVYEKIAYRGGTEGVIAEVKTRHYTLDSLKLSERLLIIVLESVEKPGNLGAVLRSADASGADAMIVCDPLTDLYNPNLIRSSVGGIFSVQCVACSSEECINFLKSHQIQILTAQLQNSELYYNTDMSCGTAIVMGTESTGLTQIWRDAADAHIRIPMLGQLDSLNVSVSASILLYEAVRQRQQG